MKRTITLLSLIITIILFSIIGFSCEFIYSLNDDVLIHSILSGQYMGEPSAYAVYLQFPLALFLSTLYAIVPSIPWFGFFMCSVYIVCFFLILRRLFILFPSKWGMLISGLITVSFFLLFLFSKYVIPQYTVTSAMLGGTGLFLYISSYSLPAEKKTNFTTRNIPSIILLLTCFLLRSQVFYMLSPFLIISIMWFLFSENRTSFLERTKKNLPVIIILGFSILICFSIHKIAYSNSEWKEYSSFNDARTSLYDYTGFPEYKSNQSIYDEIELSEADSILLSDYNNLLLPETDTDDLKKLLVYTKTLNNTGLTMINKIKQVCINYLVYSFIAEYRLWTSLLIAGYLLIIALVIIAKKNPLLFVVFCMILFRSIIWLALLWKIRFPARIQVSLMTIESLILAGCIVSVIKTIIASAAEKSKKEKLPLRFLSIAVSLFFVFSTFFSLQQTNSTLSIQKQNYMEFESVYEYINLHPDYFFFLDTFSSFYIDKVFPSYNYSSNSCLLGGWLSCSPLLEAKFEGNEITDVPSFLVDSQRAFLIVREDKSISAFEESLSSRFGEVSAKEVDRIPSGDGSEINFVVYQFILN